MENSSARTNTTPDGKARRSSMGYWILLCINYGSMFLGSIAASLMTRFYFIHGGKSRWVATWVQSSGFPILLIPIYIYPHFLSTQPPRPFSRFTWNLFFISIGVGLLTGVSNFLVSWGISYLAVSTASLVQSCQLAFNLVLSAILVKQKLTFSNLNCVVLLTICSVLIALDSDHNRPNGVSRAQFYFGFVSILGAALLFAVYLPLMEMVYRKISGYGMVMEMQLFIQIVATVFSTVGMLAGHGFHDMKKEAMAFFDLGGARYWLTLGFTLVAWQLSFMGTAGIVYLTTSLTGGICMTALLPMNVIGGVVAYGDAFGGVKAVSTVLCLWGFLSYVYGQYRKNRMEEMKREREMEMVESENVVDDGV